MSILIRTAIRSVAFAVIPTVCHAQSQRMVPRDVTIYFSGRWRCAGAFANGRPAAGDIEFRSLLGGAWLSMTQDDRPPGAYHALSLWGPTRNGGLVAYIADITGAMRQFSAPPPNAEVVLTRAADSATAVAERFIYARQDTARFLVTWETSRDSGRTWRMGDTLSCAKQ